MLAAAVFFSQKDAVAPPRLALDESQKRHLRDDTFHWGSLVPETSVFIRRLGTSANLDRAAHECDAKRSRLNLGGDAGVASCVAERLWHSFISSAVFLFSILN